MIEGERTHVRNILMGERTLCERTDANKKRGRTDLLPTFHMIRERKKERLLFIYGEREIIINLLNFITILTNKD